MSINYLPECRRGHASSPGALYDQYEKAFDAAGKLLTALVDIDFNRRDYHEENGFDSIEYGLAKTASRRSKWKQGEVMN